MSDLHKALLEVQKELKPVKKTSDNNFYKSKYADLEAVMEAVVPILSRHGLISSQTTKVIEGHPILVSSIIHVETGESVSADFPVIAKDSTDPQKVIAGLTYMRRALLSTICGLSAQDDDGNTASKSSEEPVKFKELKPKVVDDKPTGAEVTVKILGVTKDTKTGMFSIKTADGVMKTKEEVLAVMARSNIGKSPVVQYTVNPDMETILLDIIE